MTEDICIISPLSLESSSPIILVLHVHYCLGLTSSFSYRDSFGVCDLIEKTRGLRSNNGRAAAIINTTEG
jgi:hypothetical protein